MVFFFFLVPLSIPGTSDGQKLPIVSGSLCTSKTLMTLASTVQVTSCRCFQDGRDQVVLHGPAGTADARSTALSYQTNRRLGSGPRMAPPAKVVPFLLPSRLIYLRPPNARSKKKRLFSFGPVLVVTRSHVLPTEKNKRASSAPHHCHPVRQKSTCQIHTLFSLRSSETIDRVN